MFPVHYNTFIWPNQTYDVGLKFHINYDIEFMHDFAPNQNKINRATMAVCWTRRDVEIYIKICNDLTFTLEENVFDN